MKSDRWGQLLEICDIPVAFSNDTHLQMIIWPARLAERYITSEERKNILSRVNDLAQSDRWTETLSQVIGKEKWKENFKKSNYR
jgi:hypothetical protein